MAGRFRRLSEQDRRPIAFTIDGRPASALNGDTLLTALLTTQGHVRWSEFGDGARAGFCLMGACQDCWVWTESSGERVRACTSDAVEGIQILTKPPESIWPTSN
jgi:aerobic-type carbon monoxide dehydrogenase small subunit (CoxS/CutS family)